MNTILTILVFFGCYSLNQVAAFSSDNEKVVSDCAEDNQIDFELAKEIAVQGMYYDGDVTDNVACYLGCLWKNFGLLLDGNKANITAVKTFLKDNRNETLSDDVANCYAEISGDKCLIAYDVLACKP